MPESKTTILCTSSIDDALFESMKSSGFKVDIIPFIRTEINKDENEIAKLENLVSSQCIVIFTSAKAVESVIFYLKGRQPRWKIFCVGNNTSCLIAKYFSQCEILGQAPNATSLAELIISTPGIEVYFFANNIRLDALPVRLESCGIKVNEIIVYHTVVTPHKIEKNYDGILFFSPSAVKGFFELNQPGESAVMFAIGETTASEIEKYTRNQILISDLSDKSKLVERASHYFLANHLHQ